MSFEPTYHLWPKLQRQLKAIDHTAGFLAAVRLRPDWIAKVRESTQVRDALASVQIEGNSLTLEAAYELAKAPPSRPLSDTEREFWNYLQAFDAIDSMRGQRDQVISRGDLLNLHRLLLDGVRGSHRGLGEFRREDVQVGDVSKEGVHVWHTPPRWSEIDRHLDDLLQWVEATKQRGDDANDPWVHPVIQAGIVHHRLVWIHPFLDGNGRSARMFTALLLFQRGYDFKYLFELSTYYNNNRDSYYLALRTADETGDYTEWLRYFLGGFAYQMVAIQERARAGEEGKS